MRATVELSLGEEQESLANNGEDKYINHRFQEARDEWKNKTFDIHINTFEHSALHGIFVS